MLTMTRKNLLIYMLLAAALLASLLSASCISGGIGKDDSVVKAAIIDQLALLDPNLELIARATQLLENSGFRVDVWQGEEVTVDLLKNLPDYNYKLVIFRGHLGHQYARKVNDLSDVISRQITGMFTGEIYSPLKHVKEQMSGLVYAGVLDDDRYPLLFSIDSRFVKERMNGDFHDTVVIMMGCASLYYDDLARAFIDRGASAYVGWNADVTLDYLDKATIKLLENLLRKDMTLAQGIASTMTEVGTDPYYNAHLKIYSR